jgi:hypothetical protein
MASFSLLQAENYKKSKNIAKRRTFFVARGVKPLSGIRSNTFFTKTHRGERWISPFR